MPDVTDHPFWRFSLAVYARDGVAPACLALQERRDLDVNLLLFCCWAGTCGRALSAAEVARLIESVRPWREGAVRPLRAVRRWLKAQAAAPRDVAEPLRERVKAAELDAEAIEQWLLAEALPVAERPGAAQAVAANMGAYFAALGRAPDAADLADLAAVLRGCCAGLASGDAIRLLDFGDG
ncbi:MAG: TIGR02444 family protein [Kiloniellaceae bacterium]